MTTKTLPPALTTHTPAELVNLAQNLWKAQQKLKAAKLKLAPQEEVVKSLEGELQHAMIAAKMESVASKNATCSLKRTEFAEVTDFRAVQKYVVKNDAWDLIRKQVNVGAARLRWDDNLEIPGVEKGVRVDLSVTTRK
jgi:hypothetical protein